MNEIQFLNAIRAAYNYGLQQKGKRLETRITVFAWCGWETLSKPFADSIYAAYKAGLIVRGE